MASTDQGAAIPIPHGTSKITAASAGTDNAGGRAYAGAHGWYACAFANDITHGCDYREGMQRSCDEQPVPFVFRPILTIAGAAALVFNFQTSHGFLLQILAAASVSWNMSRKVGETLTIAGSSSVSANVKVARALADAITGAATVADALGVKRAIANAIAGAATVATAVGVGRGGSTGISGSGSLGLQLSELKNFRLSTTARATLLDAISVARSFDLGVFGVAVVVADLLAGAGASGTRALGVPEIVRRALFAMGHGAPLHSFDPAVQALVKEFKRKKHVP